MGQFSISDWLKCQGKFLITSFNDVCDVQENDINSTKAIARKNNGITEKALGMSLF